MVQVHFGGGILQGILKKMKKENINVKTLNFLSSKLDEIIGKSELINELLEDEEDPNQIIKLEKKLSKLEQEVDFIGNKIRVEKEIINRSKLN